MKKIFFVAMATLAMALFAADNLALNKQASASSEQNNTNGAICAVDGNAKSRWSSKFADTQWFMVDLGSAQTVGKVVIKWETAAGKEFKIQGSMDGKEWKDLFVQKDGKGKVETITFNPEKVQFVRMLGEKRLTKYGYSFFEFEVFEK